ncbi:4Fe-4S dicluster containing protein [Tistlia consotensis]|uniref:4Fe-4S dicluster containing protein n=1 Tax=Tistlia consotensis USBA 355 TaxID=560819 RepID=A0A1Y6BV82_9PROT|nr:4Fe-4S dicluster domain-containing protein [Tistlia consotensis]SMF28962.1 4Fe-4S dicluster containing protein [Tistlia consotensis USBA 355]SNR91750.1 4Fe-4S dicluster containing protein [Tistlia consotensis]
MTSDRPAVLTLEGLQGLIEALAAEGYRVLGPTRRDGAIVYDAIAGLDDLPAGWGDEQDGGRYRLVERGDAALFGYAVGPHSWKRELHPPHLTLFRTRREADGFSVEAAADEPEPTAFLGVRACELAAIAVQDRTFLEGPQADPHYARRRAGSFLVAVNCGEPAGTCFCVSMETGPRARGGYDLALTELLDAAGHRFLLEVGSERGRALAERLDARPAEAADLAASRAVSERAAGRMGRRMETGGIKALLQENQEHARWDQVAERCLSCANCTMVCPTCFCTTVEDTSDLSGETAARVRRWDSCFTLDFSYIHGGTVRGSTKARYRQWMTHKLASWYDQFGVSGCVGCGRCIAWCPVGIDITEEVAAIRGEKNPESAG